MSKTGIPYLDEAWSPVVGCTTVGEGCRNCWAYALHSQRHRLHQRGKKMPPQYAEPFPSVRCLEERLSQPLHWRKPRVVGVNFCSDTFHPDVPSEFIAAMFGAMAAASQHTYVVLTKRIERAREWFAWIVPFGGCIDFRAPKPLGACCDALHHYSKMLFSTDLMPRVHTWPLPNVWLGVSVWDQQSADRAIPLLLETPAAHRWVSYEPCLGAVDVSPWMGDAYSAWAGGFGRGVDWIVQGCESGPDRRLAKCKACMGSRGSGLCTAIPGACRACCQDARGYETGTGYAAWQWARETRDACQAAGVNYYLKQLPDAAGRVIHAPELDGRQWVSIPWA